MSQARRHDVSNLYQVLSSHSWDNNHTNHQAYAGPNTRQLVSRCRPIHNQPRVLQ